MCRSTGALQVLHLRTWYSRRGYPGRPRTLHPRGAIIVFPAPSKLEWAPARLHHPARFKLSTLPPVVNRSSEQCSDRAPVVVTFGAATLRR